MKDFLKKNDDTVNLDQIQLGVESSFDFLKKMFDKLASENGEDSKSRNKRKITLGQQFKNQLNSLMNTILSTHTNFVRCIKPNDEKLA